jgi:predicted glycosyltransferase
LYDQLSISHLSICFGSTVALESKWFGVPCITFEKRDESLIYLTDNETIFHVKELEQMVQKCTELLSKGRNEKPKLNKVADYIVETLLN